MHVYYTRMISLNSLLKASKYRVHTYTFSIPGCRIVSGFPDVVLLLEVLGKWTMFRGIYVGALKSRQVYISSTKLRYSGS